MQVGNSRSARLSIYLPIYYFVGSYTTLRYAYGLSQRMTKTQLDARACRWLWATYHRAVACLELQTPLNAERGSFSFASNVTQASRQLRFVEWLRKSAQKNILIMSKTPSSYTIHITYSASSSKKPSSHQGQGNSVFSSVLAAYIAQYSSAAQCSRWNSSWKSFSKLLLYIFGGTFSNVDSCNW